MDSTELYRQLLGLVAPWTVQQVDLDVEVGQVDVHVTHASGQRFACPECARELAVYDHAARRVWRHLDSCQFVTLLHASAPRVSCPQHGVRVVALPWAEAGSRFSRMFEALAIRVLLATNVRRAAEILRVSWDEAWQLMERAVARGHQAKRAALPQVLGVDEKAIARGHRYMTLVYDLERSTVEFIAPERKQASLEAYFDAFSRPQCAGVKAIGLDMWAPYIGACLAKVPRAGEKMVFDRFHIMSHVIDAVDTVRRQEHRALLGRGDATLAHSKYLWLYSAENVPQRSREHFEELRGAQLKTARAWALKESLRPLWSYTRESYARRFWQRWYFWATHSRLQPMIRVAKMIQSHLPNVLSYFRHRVTNAVAEGLNSKIATVQKRACGFRNVEHFKTAVYFHCGGPSLWPSSGTHCKV
jgi:transposase